MAANLPEVPVLGGLPREEPIRIPERHLGLVTADEVVIDPVREQRLAELVEQQLDLDSILRQTAWCEERAEGKGLAPVGAKGAVRDGSPAEAGVRIAVARDAAFCFYYPDNLELLQQAGAELTFLRRSRARACQRMRLGSTSAGVSGSPCGTPFLPESVPGGHPCRRFPRDAGLCRVRRVDGPQPVYRPA